MNSLKKILHAPKGMKRGRNEKKDNDIIKRVRRTEGKEERRNVLRRRIVNEILKSQKLLLYKNKQLLNIESEFATFEQADLVFAEHSAQVIIKRPKKNIPVAQWCQEIATSQMMSDYAIGPFVFEKVCNGGRQTSLLWRSMMRTYLIWGVFKI